MSEKIKFSSEQKLSFSLYLGASFSFLVWQLPADAIRCEKIHSLPCQRCRVFANSRIYPSYTATGVWVASGLVRGDGHNVCGQTIPPSCFVGAIEGQYVMYYLYYCFKMGRVD